VMVSGPVPASTSSHPEPLDAVSRVIDVAAWSSYYGLIDNRTQSLAQAVDKARAFALGPYIHALLLGDRLPEAEKDEIARALATLTGLSADYYSENNLVIKAPATDLLKSEGKMPIGNTPSAKPRNVTRPGWTLPAWQQDQTNSSPAIWGV